ncbi:MAG: hypothetical protein IIU76_05270 [Bacteroidales bacterium]|nr:hypothetical protein [Bacteroidales bacterium]
MYRYVKKSLFKAVVNLVKGVNPSWIDKGVKYPKIDLHSWIENTPIDKEQDTREISFIVEAYSNTSYSQAVDMADQISQMLCNEPFDVEGAEVVSVYPDGTEEIEEQDNNNFVIYRELHRIVVTIKNK